MSVLIHVYAAMSVSTRMGATTATVGMGTRSILMEFSVEVSRSSLGFNNFKLSSIR